MYPALSRTLLILSCGLIAALVPCVLTVEPSPTAGAPKLKHDDHRSPVDLALLVEGRRALTANHTADSVSLVDLASGKMLAELACGRKPVAVACSADGT